VQKNMGVIENCRLIESSKEVRRIAPYRLLADVKRGFSDFGEMRDSSLHYVPLRMTGGGI